MCRKKYRFGWKAFFILAVVWAGAASAAGQTGTVDETVLESLNIYLECPDCRPDFIQAEIPFIRLAEERDQAHVIVRIIKAPGEEAGTYQIQYSGQGPFEGDDDFLTFSLDPAETEDEMRQRRADTIEMGLLRYAGKTNISGRVSISFMDKVEPTAVEDKWDFWVFSISANTFLNGEKLYQSGTLFGSVTANRTTPGLKINLRASGHYSSNEFSFSGQTITSESDSKSFSGLIVTSLNEHWSAGGYLSAGSSTYNNTRFSLTPAPAVEYNVFPYSDSTRRQLRFLYRLGFNSVDYIEETVFLKTRENLWMESLEVILELKQNWGTIGASLKGSHYFHDFAKNRLTFDGDISFRLIKGLSLSVNGSYSRIRDQLFLPRQEATLEETLLRIKQLQTGFSYYISIGLSYTFGSTKSKVVNPRFGNGETSISIRM